MVYTSWKEKLTELQESLSDDLFFEPIGFVDDLIISRSGHNIIESRLPNSFFLFRTNFVKGLERKSEKIKMTEVSRLVSVEWRELSNEKKLLWKEFSNIIKESVIIEKWKELNFTEEEIELWMNIGLTIHEREFADYLRKKGYCPSAPNIKKIIIGDSWRDVHHDFNYLLRKGWGGVKFNKEQTREWIQAGAKVYDYKFVAWFRDTKNLDREWIINYKEDYEVLSERFKEYGVCSGCKQPNIGEKWCKPCNVERLEKEFPSWTSGKTEIDQFIQKCQLQATDADKFIEWIPYKQFTDIKYLAKGGFGEVYKAKWTAGNIHYWDIESKQWKREKDHYYENKDEWGEDEYYENNEYKQNKKYKNYREVVLKGLNNASTSTDFLAEITNHKVIDDWFNNIVPCYGISQNPETGNYLMVMQYMHEGDLRHYLSNKNQELTLEDKLNQLVNIARGLKDIHQKNLVHRDFHSGNILKGIEKTSCLITDLGLCKSVDEVSQEKKIFGVMPYVAPEVLRGHSYTQVADVYSFGIIAYEILSGLPPYYDRNHDEVLGVAICNGLRPQLQIKIPPLLENLIKQCWSTDPKKRLDANELERTLRDWKRGNVEFTQQLQEAEEFNKNLPDEIKFPDYKTKIHSGASYHSKLLPTKEITKMLKTMEISSSLEAFNFEESNLGDDLDWTNIHPTFTPNLISQWQSHHFTPQQTRDWINIGLQPSDHQFAAWLRDELHLEPLEVLNNMNSEDNYQEADLREQFQEFQTQIQQSPK